MESTKDVFEYSRRQLLKASSERIRALDPGPDSSAAARIRSIIDDCREVFAASATPRGISRRVTISEFEEIYRGDGDNDSRTPVEEVIQDAEYVELFAVTIGPEISELIGRHFASDELAEGYILDQIASFAADELATVAGNRLAVREALGPDVAVLPYSPGYCGWNVSGQRALFDRLQPGEIGISLNDSCLMHPVKSVSGVLIAAPITAHDFSPAFPCCASCTTLACQERVAELKESNEIRSP